MRQRVPRRAWNSPDVTGRRPRLLVEEDHPALAISDFSLFADAGFDVAFCSGPGRASAACPITHGQECPVLARADVDAVTLLPDRRVLVVDGRIAQVAHDSFDAHGFQPFHLFKDRC